MDMTWDCIVVGGGAAGLSAALVLGRARRRVLVVDAGDQSNRPAHGIGGFIGQDGRPPADFYADGQRDLAAYPSVEVRDGEVVDGRRADGGGVVLDMADGRAETARRVLLATGMDYRAPDVPGVAGRWGGSVFHCPFCHGWEVREQPLGVLDRGPGGLHRALLLRMWSDDVTLFTNGDADLDADGVARLAAAGVEVEERPVARLEGPDRALTAVVFADGGSRPCHGMLVPVTMHQRSDLAERLGAVAAPATPLAHDAVVVDGMLRTSADGVAAAGDISGAMPSVANAVFAGSMAAAALVQGLAAEDHGLPMG